MDTLIAVAGAQVIDSVVRHRPGEIKVGEMVQTAGSLWQNALQNSSCKFVLFGIPEDVGVKANLGRPGAASAVRPAFDSFLNQQHNALFPSAEVFLLGELRVDDLVDAAAGLDSHDANSLIRLRQLVAELDARVAAVVSFIVKLGRIPLVIGGSHANAFGNLKGTFDALGKRISAINCDAHLDFRPLEGRHSGNGFSYAFRDGFLDRYAVLGMHEQHNGAAALDEFRRHPDRLFFNTFESVFVRGDLSFRDAFRQCAGFIGDAPFGAELDLDAIVNVPSSAKTSSGITSVHARNFAHWCGSLPNVMYFHVAEGAPVLSHIRADNKTGKLIAYLITDFIKAVASRPVDFLRHS